MIEYKSFFHEASSSLTYVIYDSESLDALVIDPVLDFNAETDEQFTDHIGGSLVVACFILYGSCYS